MNFSQRKGLKPPLPEFQKDSMSDPLRNGLWTAIYYFYFDTRLQSQDWEGYGKRILRFGEILCMRELKIPVDDLPSDVNRCKIFIREKYFECEWHKAYDFVELAKDVLKILRGGQGHLEFEEAINQVLTAENSGYRMVSGLFVDIVDDVELESIQELLNESPFHGASLHLKSALEHYANRKTPDYRNSIKESISAVESAVREVTGKSKATLGDAIKNIEKGGHIHKALKDAFLKLYGYTSDKDGIRHAMMSDPGLTPADARYFLVVCSAFVNLLKVKCPINGAGR